MRACPHAVTTYGDRTDHRPSQIQSQSGFRRLHMSFLASSSSIAMIVFALLVPQKQKPGQVRRPTAPETFRATAKVANQAGLAGAAFVDVQVDKYTADADRDAMIATFKSGG